MRRTNLFKLPMIFLLVSAWSLTGCLPGPGSPTARPARKKMLMDGLNPDGLEQYQLVSHAGSTGQEGIVPPPPFYLTDSIIELGAEKADFLVLRAPSAEFDALLPLAKAYEPYLSGWLSQWPLLGRRGVAIDLSASGRATHRTNYQLTYAAQRIEFPVILLWDEQSEARVALFDKLTKGLNTIRCENLNQQ
jgi:hypothetical protein